MRRISGILILSLLIPILFTALPCRGAALPIVRIGVLRDGPSQKYPAYREQLIEEIRSILGNDFDVRFPEDMDLHGDWNADNIRQAAERLLSDDRTDLVIGFGVAASHMLCHWKNLPKPAVAAIIVDRKLQNLPLEAGASGVKNLSYISSYKDFERDVAEFRRIYAFKKLAVITDALYFEAIPQLDKLARKVAHEHTIDMDIVTAKTDPEKALQDIDADADAVFLTPLPRFDADAMDALISGINNRRLPSFSMNGREDVEKGVMAGIAPKADIKKLLRRIALNVQRILLGEDAGTLPVGFTLGERMSINMAAARTVGVYPTWRILTSAELLHEKPDDEGPLLTLDGAVREAAALNLELAADARKVAAGAEDVRIARAALLPQAELGLTGVLIDKDRAEASMGQAPERSWTGSATATQVLFSEKAWAGYAIQKHVQTGLEKSHESLRLDIILEAARAYLNVLRAATFEQIQKDNLELTRANLDRARIRQSVGVAAKSEVYRWESELATRQKELIAAETAHHQARIALNRLLRRPLEGPFTLQSPGIEDPYLIISDKRFYQYVDNPKTFGVFRNFMVEEALANSPELSALEASIEAQKRALASAKNDFWLPTIALQGQVEEHLSESGAGADVNAGLSMLSAYSQQGANDTDWSVALSATFTFFKGGEKYATYRKAREELEQYKTEYRLAMETLEERVRSALYQTNSSYPAIRLSRDAADAAEKNLKLVTDAYARGVVSIIELLDAQNASLVASQVAANAVYDFLIDLMTVHRAAGRFPFFMSQEEKEAWFLRLEGFF